MSTLAYTCQSKSCITGHKCVAAHPYTSSVVTGETCVSAPMHTHTDCTITADMCVVAHANQSTVPLLEISASMPKHLRKQGRIAQPLPGLTSELILVQPNQRQTLLELLHAYSLKVKISWGEVFYMFVLTIHSRKFVKSNRREKKKGRTLTQALFLVITVTKAKCFFSL